MILQFLKKILNALAIGIPPLHTPHLGCKHAGHKRQNNNHNNTNGRRATIHKLYQTNLRVNRQNSKQIQNWGVHIARNIVDQNASER